MMEKPRTNFNKISYSDVDYVIDREYTTSNSEREFTRKNRNTFFTVIMGGACLIPNQIGASEIGAKIRFTEPVENQIKFAQRQNDLFDRNLLRVYKEFEDCKPKYKISKQELFKEILSFKALNENWDGFGAIPLEIASAANAITLLNYISEDWLKTFDGIHPNPNGTISLAWENSDEERVAAEIGNETFSYYVSLSSQKSRYFNEIEINEIQAKKFLEFIQVL